MIQQRDKVISKSILSIIFDSLLLEKFGEGLRTVGVIAVVGVSWLVISLRLVG